MKTRIFALADVNIHICQREYSESFLEYSRFLTTTKNEKAALLLY